MPLDAVFLTAVVRELEQSVVGSKIDRIHQPGRDEVVLSLRGAGESMKLLLSANPARPRAHLTTLQRENPDSPPMFCMLLRKHLTGGRILAVTQPPMERVVEFVLETTDELGNGVRRRLVLEAVRGRSNLILLDGEGRITDCLRRVNTDLSARRQILPGLFYRLPPTQEKTNPMDCDRQQLCTLMSACSGARPEQCLLDTFCGISPLIAREIVFRAGENCSGSALGEQVFRLTEAIRSNRFLPYMLLRGGKPEDVSFLSILQYGPESELREYPSFSALLDDFYHTREITERLRQRGQDLIRAAAAARDRTARKLCNQARELDAARDRERLRQLGDLITSNLHSMKKGMRMLRTEDFYHPDGAQTEVKLDPLLTPQQNAAKYYREYNKAKTAERVLTAQLEKGEQELQYLNSVLETIRLAEGERDLEDIRQELVETGYLRRASKAKGREKKTGSKPMEFRSTGGFRISVGKNNTQNDRLTTKLAGKGDIWFHAQKAHGAHVILWTGGGTPDAGSIADAAMLAAWFSQAREGQKVPVDYTAVKFVKKPAAARPGMVVYSTCKTVYVTPDEKLADALRAEQEP